jgi:hypothetical protein
LTLIGVVVACGQPPRSQPSPDVTAVLNSARAFDCGRVCKSFILDFRLRNNSPRLFCFSSEYGDDLVAADVEVRTSSGTVETPVRDTGLLAPREPGPVGLAKGMLQSGNFVVQPHGAQAMSTISKDFFELERSPSVLQLTILAYPCDAHDLNPTTVKVFKLSRALEFQPE